ncbi:MAG: capsule assembly Wzi family protein [Gammaproteobacteria bacterium]
MRSILATIIFLAIVPTVLAGPWIDPGDSALRHDIQVLADAGVITGPVTTWPLSWADVQASLQAHEQQKLGDGEKAALGRLKSRLARARASSEVIWSGHVSASEHPTKIRTFESVPRENAEIGGGLEWTGNRFAARLQAQLVDDADDGKDWRYDNSYLGMALGNWMLAATTSDQYWGPSWQSSMLLSNNARPIPSFTVGRNLTTPFETKWLSWLGPWDVSVLWGYLEHDRAVPDARVFAGRFNFRPLKGLEIGLSAMSLWCGSGEDCDASTFGKMITGGGESSQFDRLSSFDIRWASEALGRPFAVYAHAVGEDFGDGNSRFVWPTKVLMQIGTETWGYREGLGSYRFFVEWADTECDAALYRTLTFDGDGGKPGCAYRNQTYQSGETYRNRVFANSLDQDSQALTFGSVLNRDLGRSWQATIVLSNLNRYSRDASTTARNKTRYGDAALSHQLPAFFGGEFNLGLGYEYRKDTVLNETDHDVRAFAGWSFEY